MSVFLPDSTHLLVLLAKSDSIVDWTILYDGIRLHELFQQQPMLRYISYSNESSNAELTGSAMVLFRPLDTALTADAVSKISSALEGLLGSTSISVEGRLYDTQSPVTATDFIGSGPHILVFNAMTPSSNSESSFNDWYAQEHIPLLSRVPGWRASRRFTLVFATRDAPQYLALHAFRDFSAFETSEYREATTTPWRAEVIGNVVEKERIVLEIDNDRSLLGDNQPAASSD